MLYFLFYIYIFFVVAVFIHLFFDGRLMLLVSISLLLRQVCGPPPAPKRAFSLRCDLGWGGVSWDGGGGVGVRG